METNSGESKVVVVDWLRGPHLLGDQLRECLRDDTYRRRQCLSPANEPEWWEAQAGRHSLHLSEEVLAELSSPRYPQGADALKWVAQVPRLAITDQVLGFADVLVRERVMPSPVAGDAIHIAAAAVHGMDYVLSWNVRHLANPNKLVHLRTVCVRAGLLAPQIVTPDLLWESDDERQQTE